MKKIALLTATALTFTSIAATPVMVHAKYDSQKTQTSKSDKVRIMPNGNKIIISYNSGCNINIKGIFDKLENCFPENNLPETDMPNTEIPDINIPDIDIPEMDYPNIPDNDNNSNDNNVQTPFPEDEDTHAFVQQVVDLVNIERAKEGLSPLTIDSKVQKAAQVRAKECEELFSHTRPNGSSFSTALKEHNVSYKRAGENIAWGQRSPQAVMNSWMNSKGHRANIMNPDFTSIGIGYYQNANGTNYWCQLFIK